MKSKEIIDKGSEYIAEQLSHVKGNIPQEGDIFLKECLKVALNKELIESQRPFQDAYIEQAGKLVAKTDKLVKATWALAIATIITGIATAVCMVLR